LNIINKYKEKIPVIISEKDKGHIDAMNKGIKMATGEVIYILNADDSLCDHGVVSDVMGEFNNDPQVDFIYGKVKLTGLPAGCRHDTSEEQIFSKNDLLKKSICHQALFCRKSLFVKSGPLDTQYRICADFNWLISVFSLRGIKVKYIDRYIASYNCQGPSYRNRPLYWRERIQIVRRRFPFIVFLPYLITAFWGMGLEKIAAFRRRLWK
jgi:glycosyltransferase involved in cell wall biosynthesis